jgi:serine kinase of HPr protein (carbohydrate metabolism regulator)
LIPVSAVLVSDDQVFASVLETGIELQAPAPILGNIEVRGLGLVEVPYTERANLTLLVDIVAPSDVVRLPEDRTERVLGFEIPLITIAPFENSAPLKLLLALSRASSPLKAPP